jgi:exodeoxyribonuclease V beta subunit
METFDLLGPLPAARTTTVLEASAGTGKTFALAGLVTRYLAEGKASLDQMLLITFARAASQELRERVRRQIHDAVVAFDDPSTIGDNELLQHLVSGTEGVQRQRRLRDALAGFDAATIATTHQFCQLVLKSLGVAADTDAGVTLVENLDELVREIVDDLYLAHFGQQTETPLLGHQSALTLAKEVINNPSAQLRPLAPTPDTEPAVRVDFANRVRAELDRRKRQRGILGYDDLLSRLAAALAAADSPARARMHQQWPIVMVDEFQDTDPVQWQVIDRAFSRESTLILIGDPKQAIYAFRGGDVVTYLDAARTAGELRTLGTNWRSDSALVERVQAVLRGAQLGNTDIVVHDVHAHHQGHRLSGAPHNAPFRLRVVPRTTFGRSGTQEIPIADLRAHIGADLAADIAALLDSDATFDGRGLQAPDIAVIVEKHRDANACHDALTAAGIAAVYTGESDVFATRAADDWLCLLEAFDQPHRSGLVRAAAATFFFGETAASLAHGEDALTDTVADTLREWSDHARERGVASIFEAAQLAGMGRRLLTYRGGERHLTDLAHVTQLLHDTAHREHYSLPALRDWLRSQREDRSGAIEHTRRLDSDAAAVQIMTVWASKGLQYPIVYLPFAFNYNVQKRDLLPHHDNGARCLHIGGEDSPDFNAVERLSRREAASDHIRLTYVAITRAQSQVVAWWAPSKDEPNGGLSRLLRGRKVGEAAVPDRCPGKMTDQAALRRFDEWSAVGGPVIETSVVAPAPATIAASAPAGLAVRHFGRAVDTTWRRTSYSGLIRNVATTGVSSEPEVSELDDEAGDIPLPQPPSGSDVASPMAHLPTGATFGSLAHAVLETADPFAPDLAAELATHIRAHSVWWPVNVTVDELATALVPMHDTPLGPLAPALTLRQIGLRDRLRELEFELPLDGGDLRGGETDVRLADVAALLRKHLAADDPLAPYANRLSGDALGRQSLRGYLSGSIDAVLRTPSGYLVVDYKTNRLGDAEAPLTAADYDRPQLVGAMLHSDYPLQALLYTVVLHRFLRWRQPGYHPQRDLGGVLYLFLRGMCGAQTPVIDGHPCGVFSWRPPVSLILAVSDVLHAKPA